MNFLCRWPAQSASAPITGHIPRLALAVVTAVIVGTGAAPPAVAGTAANVFAAVVTPPPQPPYPPGYLACVDAATLRPVGSRVPIEEFHGAWALSPDGSLLAIGLSDTGRAARTGIRIFDARTLAQVRDVETGASADAIAWVSPRRLLARAADGAVLIDPQEGRILSRARSGVCARPTSSRRATAR